MVPLQLFVASALAWSGEPHAVILDFTSIKCQPCQQISGFVSKLERDGVPIRRVDVLRERELAQQYHIETIPAFVLLIDGEEVSRSRQFNQSQGVTAEGELRRLCGMLPAPEPEPKSNPRQTSRLPANSIDLGESAPLPTSAPQKTEPQKPGVVERLLGRKKKAVAPSGPLSVRGQNGSAPVAPAVNQPVTPLSATVRLHVKDAQGENFGTGTIIDSRPGNTLILTCGHLFRQWKRGAQVQVDIFIGDEFTTIVGTNVVYELDEDAGLDVGLISIPTDTPLPACRIAPPGTKILSGARVVSVGCGGGDKPTVQAQKITALNRYKGADNIECSAIPVVGRSGGGLFDRDGQVIGVCMCADPHYQDGLYAGLKTIHGFLDRRKLTHVYRSTTPAVEEPVLASIPPAEPRSLAAQSSHGIEAQSTRSQQQATPDADDLSAESLRTEDPAVSQDDILGSEIVIIVNAKGRPGSPTKYVRLHRASRGFWENLLPELDQRAVLQETTLKRVDPDAAPPLARREVRRPETTTRRTAQAVCTEEHAERGPEPFRRQRMRNQATTGSITDEQRP